MGEKIDRQNSERGRKELRAREHVCERKNIDAKERENRGSVLRARKQECGRTTG